MADSDFILKEVMHRLQLHTEEKPDAGPPLSERWSLVALPAAPSRQSA
jgi:hypothetical protein